MSKKGAISLIAIALIFAVAVKWRSHVRLAAADKQCAENLRQIDGAKQQWALENWTHVGFDEAKGEQVVVYDAAYSNAVPTVVELTPYLGRQYPHSMPQCPRGGSYTIGRVADLPTCSFPGHALK